MVNYDTDLEGKTVLVTSTAGFIGSNFVKPIFHDIKDIKIVGIDSITDSYDTNLKYDHLKEIEILNRDWIFVHVSIADKTIVDKVFQKGLHFFIKYIRHADYNKPRNRKEY